MVDAVARVGLLHDAYRAFNQRRIEDLLALMVEDVAWPDVARGEVLRSHDEVRAYWDGQFEAASPQVVRNGLRMVAAGAKDGKVIAANMWGKVKTVLQMLSIIFYFFGTALSYRGTVDSVSIVVVVSIALCWLVAAVTAISGIKYLWDNRSFINTAK